jgi:hypothetical protein
LAEARCDDEGASDVQPDRNKEKQAGRANHNDHAAVVRPGTMSARDGFGACAGIEDEGFSLVIVRSLSPLSAENNGGGHQRHPHRNHKQGDNKGPVASQLAVGIT